MEEGVFVGLGGNLPAAPWGSPRRVMEAAVAALAGTADIRVLRRSRWYRSPPEPPSAQPWFVNGVVEIATALPPAALLTRLHAIEARFGRVHGERNAARSLDLDLLAYGEITSNAAGPLILPHPRMHQRAFVLAPLCDIAPAWRHPRLHRSAAQLLAALAPEQTALPIVGDGEA
jgi:2-amino-4-hydroxy-6-hydroxymethyldihydropteridine diphosphokinase